MFQAAINKLMDTLDEDDIAKLEETQPNWLTQGQPCELKRKAAEKWVSIISKNVPRYNSTTLECEALYLNFMKTKPGQNCSRCELPVHENFVKIIIFQA